MIRSDTREVKIVLRRCSAATAVIRSSIPSDLKTHPRTPASRQSRTTCSDSTAVRIRITWSGLCFRICRAASSPFRSGMQMSKITRSGFNCLHFSTASRPSADELKDFTLRPVGNGGAVMTYTAEYSGTYGNEPLQMKAIYGEVWVKVGRDWKLLWVQETK